MSILTDPRPESTRTSPRRHLFAWLVCVTAFFPAPASGAQEEVVSYKATLDVQEDGWLEVTEEIVVRASTETLRSRVHRDVETRVPRPGGTDHVTAPLRIVRVLVDGRPESYTLEGVGGVGGIGVVRIRMGDPGRRVSPGEHTYALTYRTTRRLTFEDGTTQLSWNVTGDGWRFPIRSASARVLLPGEVPENSVTMEAWTGRRSARDAHVASVFSADPGSRSRATFVTTAPLGRSEGLTIRLVFPGGLVSPPAPAEVAAWTDLDREPYVRGAQLVLGVLLMYGLMWILVGRDPRGRPVVVRYDPPVGFSPAALGYLDKGRYHASQLTAAVVSLAVKGALRIESEGRNWTLRRNEVVPDTLTRDERILLEKLLGDGHTYLILGISLQRVRDAKRALRRELKRSLEARYFVANRGWFVAGLLLSMGGFLALTLRTPRPGVAVVGLFQACMLLLVTTAFGRFMARGIRDWRTDVEEMDASPAAASVFPLLSLAVSGMLVVLIREAYLTVPLSLVLVAVALGLLNSVFSHLLQRPTRGGEELVNHTEGFKRFLVATEGARLDNLQPDRTPLQFFEQMLPYALALGVASAWASRFGEALRAGEFLGVPSGGRVWYVGSKGASAEAFTSSLSGGLSESLSEATKPPDRKRVRSTRPPA